MEHPVREGDTLLRPVRSNTPLVQSVLGQLEAAGAEWAPRPLGVDQQRGLEIVSWIPGQAATSAEEVDLIRLVEMVRTLHDVTAMLVDAECVIHDDLQPRNIVLDNRQPVGLIDWEQARPGRRVEDVADLCWSFIEPKPGIDPFELARGWRGVLDSYGLDDRHLLVPTMLSRMQVCYVDIEREAASGSKRHQELADNGDHLAIRSMLGWVLENHRTISNAIAS